MRAKHGFVSFINRLAVLLCAFMLLLTSFAGAESEEFDDQVRRFFKTYKTTGGMVLAAKDGQIVYQLCYGYANKKADEKVSPETYFKLASVSKLVTAVCAMKLVETGRLDLDENIGHILGDPAFEAASAKFPKQPITSRMLMTHTASIKDGAGAFTKKEKLSEALNPKKNRTGSGFLDSKPGSAYQYSNYGAGMIGSILEAITGERLSDAAKSLIFNDMGIDAAYDPHCLQYPERIVTTYRANGNTHITRSYRLKQAYRETVNVDKDYHESYGGLFIKGEDLCRIGIMLCGMGEIDGKRILEEETIREMLSNQQGKGGITADSPYALNVERVTNLIPGKMLYGHQGMAEAVLCNLYFDPETNFVFALLTNGCNVKAKEDRICKLARVLFDLMWKTYSE